MSTLSTKFFQLKDGRTASLRSARPADAERIFTITRDVIAEGIYIVTAPEEFSSTVETERDWIEVSASDSNALLLVAEVSDRVVGFLNFHGGQRRRHAHRGRFHMLIEPDWRQLGVGRALIQALLDWTIAHPIIEKVSFAVFSNNTPAIELYKRFGFQEEGRKLKEIKLGEGDYVDEILMYRFVADL